MNAFLNISEPNLKINSSSQHTKNLEYPGSPWRPERPLNWLSIRLASWRSVPITHNPAAWWTSLVSLISLTPSPSLISVPRPAILVAIVIAPNWPAFSIIWASLSWFLAFKTSCGKPSLVKRLDKSSLFSTETVPTKIGWPNACLAFISLTIALYLAFSLP